MFISIVRIRTVKCKTAKEESNTHTSHQDNILNKIQTTHQPESQPFTEKNKTAK